MATIRYKERSPYQIHAFPPPKEDEQYSKYLSNLKLEQQTKDEVTGVALFGTGRAGTIHLSYLAASTRVKLLYIVDDDKERLVKLKTYWSIPDVKFITSSEASVAYNDPEVGAVIIASPTFTHEQFIRTALEHNKPVLCEKPIAESIEQSRSCYELAKKRSLPLLSAFNRRFDPAFASVRNRVRNGEIGMVLTVKVCSRDSPLPSLEYLRHSGGIFHDCAVHDIDMILFILGEYPTKVSVLANANIPEIAGIDDFDTVAITLSFDSGALGIIDLSRHCAYGYDQRIEVFGQKGMLKCENKQPLQNVELYTHENIRKSPIDYSFPSRHKEGYVNEVENFLDVVQGRSNLSIDVRDTLAVTRIAAACEESVRTSQVIKLKWSEVELP